MSSPDDLTTVLVTGQYFRSDGEPATGVVTFTPSEQIADRSGRYLIAATTRRANLDALGRFSIRLYATDDARLSPIGWTWRVTQLIEGAEEFSWNLQLIASMQRADISSLPIATGY